MTADPLEQLKGLHLPAEPGIWPLAPAWWLVLLTVLLLMLGLCAWIWHRRRLAPRRALERGIEQELLQLRRVRDSGNIADYLPTADQFLRRLLRLRLGAAVASQTGEQWLQTLQKQTPSALKDADWRPLVFARYQPHPPSVDLSQLHAQLERFVKNQQPC